MNDLVKRLRDAANILRAYVPVLEPNTKLATLVDEAATALEARLAEGWPEDWVVSMTKERPFFIYITKPDGGEIMVKPVGHVSADEAKIICERIAAPSAIEPASPAPSDGMVEALREARTFLGELTATGTLLQEIIALRTKIDTALSTKGAAPSVSDELVKALEWESLFDSTVFTNSNSDLIDYRIYAPIECDNYSRETFELAEIGHGVLGQFATFDEAKAAAQADFNTRIRSALPRIPSASGSAGE